MAEGELKHRRQATVLQQQGHITRKGQQVLLLLLLLALPLLLLLLLLLSGEAGPLSLVSCQGRQQRHLACPRQQQAALLQQLRLGGGPPVLQSPAGKPRRVWSCSPQLLAQVIKQGLQTQDAPPCVLGCCTFIHVCVEGAVFTALPGVWSERLLLQVDAGGQVCSCLPCHAMSSVACAN